MYSIYIRSDLKVRDFKSDFGSKRLNVNFHVMKSLRESFLYCIRGQNITSTLYLGDNFPLFHVGIILHAITLSCVMVRQVHGTLQSKLGPVPI